MSAGEAEAPAANDLKSGPFSVLYNAVRGNTQVLVNVRNNHKLLGRVKAYDRHMNLYVLPLIKVFVVIVVVVVFLVNM
jgi:small nuclear ribonucleoprotein D2